MSALDKLREARPQVLLAELAGLLHNLSKLHGDFLLQIIKSATPAGFQFNDQCIDDPAQIIKFRLVEAEPVIKTATDRRNEVRSLLGDSRLWPGQTALAMELLTHFNAGTRTTPKVKEIGKDLRGASQRTTDVTTAERIAAEIKSALSLSELMQSSGLNNYLTAPEKKWLRENKLKILVEEHSFSELLLLYWDDFHWLPGTPNDQARIGVAEKWVDHATTLPRYLAVAHGVTSAGEKKAYVQPQNPPINKVFRATAFGYEKNKVDAVILDDARAQLFNLLLSADLNNASWREGLSQSTDRHLGLAMGDTQWPVNDVTLWDYASTVALLYKSAVAKAVIEEKFVETSELEWRFLSIRYNGLDYLSRAHHVSDLLARRKLLQAALDAVKVLIEVDCPLGNEVYRDENGSVLVVPHVSVDGAEDVLKLPAGEGLDSPKLEQELRRRFAAAGKEPLAGELVPMVSLSGEVRGKDLRLTDVKPWQPASFADPAEIDRIWKEEKKRGDICTVCGVRPEGYGASEFYWKEHSHEEHAHRAGEFPEFCQICKAQSRSLCCVCMDRRDERSEDWANNKEGLFKQTIWVDEVADNDGRLALLVGRFELDGWLSGQLIPTMMKDASFARVRRCWETTRKFWEDVERKLPELVGGYERERLMLIPETPLALGKYHAYDLKIKERFLSVVFAPDSATEAKGCLLTADNLDYARQLLAVGDLRAYLNGKNFELHESSGYGNQRRRRITVKIKDAPPVSEEWRYAPAITILSEPALYLALVPADKALAVAQHIREKYEREMARVRDRLPLQVGLIFAPRRTPMRALLEAGQRMLKLPLKEWEQWEIGAIAGALTADGCRALTFKNGVTWNVPVKMGDYDHTAATGTADDWYPHFLTREPTAGEDLTVGRPWKHARELDVGDKVMLRPSRFDFEFLDTTSRRLEISYDNGRRRGLATRPFLLEKLGEFEQMWQALIGGARKLGKSQLQNFEGAVIERVAAWHGGDLNAALRDEVFQQFAEDTLHRLDQGWWKTLQAEQKQALECAARDGTLLDLLDLRMHILKEPRDERNGNAAQGE
jgi:hypothetical protein